MRETGEDDCRSPSRTIEALGSFDLYRLHDDIFVRTILPVARAFRNLLGDVVSFNHLAENCVLAGQPVSIGHGNKKLRAVRVRSGVSHRQLAALVEPVRRSLGLIFKLVARTAKTRAHRVSALNHEVWDHAMKDSSVVKRILTFSARSRVRPLAFAFGKLNKVGHGLRSIFFKKPANNVAFAGFNYGISSRCASHNLLK